MDMCRQGSEDRKSTRLNSSHTVIYTLSLHDALPISSTHKTREALRRLHAAWINILLGHLLGDGYVSSRERRSEEHTSELQSHSDLHSFPTRRSSDLFYT